MNDLANLADSTSTLHDKVARLEALLDRLSIERASRIPSHACSVQVARERSSSGSPMAKQRDNREMIDQLSYIAASGAGGPAQSLSSRPPPPRLRLETSPLQR